MGRKELSAGVSDRSTQNGEPEAKYPELSTLWLDRQVLVKLRRHLQA